MAEEEKAEGKEAEAEKTLRAEATARMLEAVKQYAEMAERGEDTMTLGSGVEVTLVPLPPLLTQRVDDQFPDPEPPMVEVEVHGKKVTQPNPDDPDYAKELERVKMAKGWAYLDLVFLKGIKFDMPEDEEWLEELTLAGIEVGESKAAKRLAYVESVLITNVAEFEEVTGRVLAMSGVTPQAIDEAAKTVPD